MIEILVQIFRIYTIFLTKINDYYNYLYHNFSLFKKSVNKVELYKYYLFSKMTNTLISYPFNCFYICNINDYIFYEHKIDLPEYIFSFEDQIENNKSELMNLIENNSLLLLKTDNCIKCNIIENKNSIKEIPENLNSTKKYFLTVTYGHPKLDYEIELDINSFFVENNEILNYTFVLRQLKYQPAKYIFDNEYYVKIIDDKCNIITINSKEYVKISKDNYEIKEYKINNLLFQNNINDSIKKKDN